MEPLWARTSHSRVIKVLFSYINIHSLLLFSALDILIKPQANPAAVTAYLVVEVQALITDAEIFERLACTAMFPLHTIDVLLIVFNVTAQLFQFTDST